MRGPSGPRIFGNFQPFEDEPQEMHELQRLQPQELQRLQPQELQRLQPQKLQRLQPHELQRLQPHELQRLQPQVVEVPLLLLLPVDVPATVPLWLQRQVQVQVQPVLLSDVPPTEPLEELFAQHGLQQEFCTKLGKIMPPKQPELQELHIVCASIKKMSRSISLHDILCRILPGCYDLMPPFVAFACSTPWTIGSSGSRISCGFGSCSCFFIKNHLTDSL